MSLCCVMNGNFESWGSYTVTAVFKDLKIYLDFLDIIARKNGGGFK